MKKAILKEAWKPLGIDGLEDNALAAVHCEKSQIIVAGPGAGKTELLAQRACYLLQTHLCPPPKRILAISFKRDSAQNLKERVNKRCDKDLAARFDSMTFDEFAKKLLDRFMPGLPKEFKPKWDYKVNLSPGVYTEVAEKIDRGFAAAMTKDQLSGLVIGSSLPYLAKDPKYNPKSMEMWNMLLNGSKTSHLTFPMITRLAELIISQNLILHTFLQKAYAFVFLDEFQDTTGVQYALLKACFYQSSTVLTAVGDDRQRIMGWAGALGDAFERFKKDFDAGEEVLRMNYRSAPRLVEVQKVLSNTLLGKQLEPQTRLDWRPEDGIAEIWHFPDHKQEIKRIVTETQKCLDVEKLEPRDICVLVKQQLPVYADELILELNNAGINARNEDKYQAVLTEEIVKYLVSFLFWVLNEKSLEESRWVMNFYSKISNAVTNKEITQAEQKITSYKRSFQKQAKQITEEGEWKALFDEMLTLLNRKFLEAYCPEYRDEDYLQTLVRFVSDEFLIWMAIHKDPVCALDKVIGRGSIPIMTVHKSKGLEYHTVIFIGLEDGAFWSFSTQPHEDKCTFFVAMSRAKQRIVFTFSNSRPDKYGNARTQNKTSISSLYEALRESGIVVESVVIQIC